MKVLVAFFIGSVLILTVVGYLGSSCARKQYEDRLQNFSQGVEIICMPETNHAYYFYWQGPALAPMLNDDGTPKKCRPEHAPAAN